MITLKMENFTKWVQPKIASKALQYLYDMTIKGAMSRARGGSEKKEKAETGNFIPSVRGLMKIVRFRKSEAAVKMV